MREFSRKPVALLQVVQPVFAFPCDAVSGLVASVVVQRNLHNEAHPELLNILKR